MWSNGNDACIEVTLLRLRRVCRTLGPYAAGNAVGFIPGTLLFSSLGHQARQLHGLVMYSADHSNEEWVLIAVEAAITLMAVVGLGVYYRRVWTSEQERFGGTKPSTTELE
jgi:hypothetical protein